MIPTEVSSSQSSVIYFYLFESTYSLQSNFYWKTVKLQSGERKSTIKFHDMYINLQKEEL